MKFLILWSAIFYSTTFFTKSANAEFQNTKANGLNSVVKNMPDHADVVIYDDRLNENRDFIMITQTEVSDVYIFKQCKVTGLLVEAAFTCRQIGSSISVAEIQKIHTYLQSLRKISAKNQKHNSEVRSSRRQIEEISDTGAIVGLGVGATAGLAYAAFKMAHIKNSFLTLFLLGGILGSGAGYAVGGTAEIFLDKYKRSDFKEIYGDELDSSYAKLLGPLDAQIRRSSEADVVAWAKARHIGIVSAGLNKLMMQKEALLGAANKIDLD